MKLIIKPLIGIISYALALFVMNYYGFLFGIKFFYGSGLDSFELVKVYILIGAIFWFGFSILKWIFDILTLPLQYMTIWLVGRLTNIAIMYICQFVINIYLTGVQMQITSFARIIVTSVILSFIVSTITRIINKVI